MEMLSSTIVNDGIKEFYIFLREDPTYIKDTKSDFHHLRCFYVHTKNKKHKTSNKRLSSS